MSESHQQRLPLAVRCINKSGHFLQCAGLTIAPLSAENLLARACRETGLADWGDASFQPGFEKLVDSLNGDARLSLLGRFMARADLQALLVNRLRLVDYHHRHPSIGQQRIERPIFILGLPRTGTSIMHELFAQDLNVRVPMTWEVKYPFPPPEAASFHGDARIAKVEKELSAVDKLLPEFKKMHPMGAEYPQECVAITSMAFLSVIFDTQYCATGYQDWLDTAEMAPAYRYHRQFLQLLQWKTGNRRWVLKSPGHLWALDALLDEYPDACIVQTHRDPLRVLTSVSSLIATLRTMSSDEVDREEIARRQAQLLHDGLSRTMAVRDSGRLANAQVIDVQFSDFMRDPVAMIARIYQHFDQPFSATARQRMSAFLAANPSDKHGRHAYRFADTGLDLAQQRERFRAYQTRFDVTSEAL